MNCCSRHHSQMLSPTCQLTSAEVGDLAKQLVILRTGSGGGGAGRESGRVIMCWTSILINCHLPTRGSRVMVAGGPSPPLEYAHTKMVYLERMSKSSRTEEREERGSALRAL